MVLLGPPPPQNVSRMQSNTRKCWNNLALYMGVLYLLCTTIRIELGLVSINIVCIKACPGKKRVTPFRRLLGAGLPDITGRI